MEENDSPNRHRIMTDEQMERKRIQSARSTKKVDPANEPNLKKYLTERIDQIRENGINVKNTLAGGGPV